MAAGTGGTNSPADAPTIRLLIAEDEMRMRQTLIRLFAAEPDVELVGDTDNGESALEMARFRRPDVLLSDIGMPRRDGISLTQAIRDEKLPVAVVILTIYDDDNRVFSAIKAGARGYVLKDGTPDEIVAAVRAAARGEALLDHSLVARVMEEFARVSTRKIVDNTVFADLTDREREVLTEVGKGKRNRDIGEALFISEKTVKNHLSNIFDKLEINTRAEAALIAARQGLV